MSDDEMSLEEYGKRYIELGGMDDGFAWALHPDLCNRSEIMERVIKQAHGILYEHRGEVDRLRAENERLGAALEDAASRINYLLTSMGNGNFDGIYDGKKLCQEFIDAHRRPNA